MVKSKFLWSSPTNVSLGKTTSSSWLSLVSLLRKQHFLPCKEKWISVHGWTPNIEIQYPNLFYQCTHQRHSYHIAPIIELLFPKLGWMYSWEKSPMSSWICCWSLTTCSKVKGTYPLTQYQFQHLLLLLWCDYYRFTHGEQKKKWSFPELTQSIQNAIDHSPKDSY